MDPLTGALVASAVAWASILLALRVPLDRWVDPRGLRLVGGATLALLALGALGLPVPARLPLALLAAGILALALARAVRAAGARGGG